MIEITRRGQVVARSRNLRGLIDYARRVPIENVSIGRRKTGPGQYVGGIDVFFSDDAEFHGEFASFEVLKHWLLARRGWRGVPVEVEGASVDPRTGTRLTIDQRNPYLSPEHAWNPNNRAVGPAAKQALRGMRRRKLEHRARVLSEGIKNYEVLAQLQGVGVDELTTAFYVNAPGAAVWAKHQQSIAGSSWEADGPDMAYAIAYGDALAEAHEEGYRVRLAQDYIPRHAATKPGTRLGPRLFRPMGY